MLMEKETVLVTGGAAHGATGGKMSTVAHIYNTLLEIVTNTEHVKHPYTENRTILHHPYFAVDRPDFPGQTLLFNAVSLSSVPRVVPRRLGNRPQDDQKSPALSVARPRYITTNQPAHHNPAHHLRIFHFFTHHGPTADRPSVHGTSRHHHHHTLVRSLYTVPRSLARLALALTRSFLRLSLSLHLRTPSRCERVRYRYTYSMRTHTHLTFRRVTCACPSI